MLPKQMIRVLTEIFGLRNGILHDLKGPLDMMDLVWFLFRFLQR